jgi:hypothetical protein
VSARWGGGRRGASRHGTGLVLNGVRRDLGDATGGCQTGRVLPVPVLCSSRATAHGPNKSAPPTTTHFRATSSRTDSQPPLPAGRSTTWPQPFMTVSVQREGRLAAIPAPGNSTIVVVRFRCLLPSFNHQALQLASKTSKEATCNPSALRRQSRHTVSLQRLEAPLGYAQSAGSAPPLDETTLAVSTRPWDGMDGKGCKTGEIAGGLIGSAAAQRRGRRCGCVEPCTQSQLDPCLAQRGRLNRSSPEGRRMHHHRVPKPPGAVIRPPSPFGCPFPGSSGGLRFPRSLKPVSRRRRTAVMGHNRS